MITNYEDMLAFLKVALDNAKVVYGYSRTAKPAKSGTSTTDIYYSYMFIQKDVSSAVGQAIKSTSEVYIVAVQANYAKTCFEKINAILKATEGTNVRFISSSVRVDPNIESSHIGSITLSLYKGDSDIR